MTYKLPQQSDRITKSKVKAPNMSLPPATVLN